MDAQILAILMFVVVCGVLLLGFPVAFTLGGVALLFAGVGSLFDVFDLRLLGGLSSRYFGVMVNEVLVAVPLFVFMGVTLERARIAEQLLETMGLLFGRMRGGLGLSVIFVGMLLAASTGIVGATVVTMGLLSLPTMLKAGYDPKLATGTICASGTLGQIIPPSIVLVLLGDILQGSYSQAQMAVGNYAPEPISVIDLFAGAFIPGMVLVVLYMGWVLWQSFANPQSCPALVAEGEKVEGLGRRVAEVLVPPALLILAVLGSILAGVATPTEAAAVGSIGAILLAGAGHSRDKTLGRPSGAFFDRGGDMAILVGAGSLAVPLILKMALTIASNFLDPAVVGLLGLGLWWLSLILLLGWLWGLAVVLARLFRNFRFDCGNNLPVVLAALSLGGQVALTALFDMRMQRDAVPIHEAAAFLMALLLVPGWGWGLWASLARGMKAGVLNEIMRTTLQITTMVFVIFLGASLFSLVFRGFGGDDMVADLFASLPGGVFGAMAVVMAVMFVLGFFLDFIEIIFVVVPIVGPVLLQMDISPIWFGVMIAINLQTSFLTPPFGFALFYLRGVAPEGVRTMDIYRGIVPFVAIQIVALGVIAAFPALVTWLPKALFP